MLAFCFWGAEYATPCYALMYHHRSATTASGDAMTLAVELARFDKWSVQVTPWPEYANAAGKAWWRVYLFADVRPGRFYLMWDGERFARSGEFHRASKSQPDVLDKAKAVLAHAIPRQ